MALEINETKEYLGLLRHKQAVIQWKLKNAEEQIGAVCNALCDDGISELSSDEEDNEAEADDLTPPVPSKDLAPPSSANHLIPPLSSDDLTSLVSSNDEAQWENDSSGGSLEASDDAHCPALCTSFTTPSIGEAKSVLCTESVEGV